MAASEVEICNMALSHLGTAHEIEDLEIEDTQEAIACRRFYQVALDLALRDFDWSFSTATVELAKVAELDVLEGGEFAYSYRYPANAVKIRRIHSGTRVDTNYTARPYRITQDASGKLILIDAGSGNYYDPDSTWAEITVNDVAPQFYPADFTLAFSYLLANFIAPRLTKGDPMGLGPKALQKYYLMASTATKNDAKEFSPDLEYDSEFIRVRW